MPFCVYCGNEVRSNDKFCLYCGKPRVVKSAPSSKEDLKKAEPIPEKEPFEEVKKDMQSGDSKSKKGDEAEGKKTVKQEKKREDEKNTGTPLEEKDTTPATGDKQPVSTSAHELPSDIREQIDIRMEIELLRVKKKKIADKIEEVTKLLDEPDYELDIKYRDDVNLKIKAIREVKAELDKEEDELKKRIDPSFRLISLPTRIKVLKDQIDELKTNYKFNKVDKEVFEQLNNEYTSELKQVMKEHADLLLGIKAWVTKLKTEKLEQERELKLAKARFKSKEISKERLQVRQDEVELQVNKIEGKIKVIQQFLEK